LADQSVDVLRSDLDVVSMINDSDFNRLLNWKKDNYCFSESLDHRFLAVRSLTGLINIQRFFTTRDINIDLLKYNLATSTI
jgi:hypothetical protein